MAGSYMVGWSLAGSVPNVGAAFMPPVPSNTWKDPLLRLLFSKLIRKLLVKLAVYVLEDIPVLGKLARIVAYAC